MNLNKLIAISVSASMLFVSGFNLAKSNDQLVRADDSNMNSQNTRTVANSYNISLKTQITLKRGKKYQIISTKNIQTKFFIHKYGYFNSKDLKKVYIPSYNPFLILKSNKKEILYNKKNHRYYTYYYVTYNNSTTNIKGWVLSKNVLLVPSMYKGHSSEILNLFKGSKKSQLYQQAAAYRAVEEFVSDPDIDYSDVLGNKNYKEIIIVPIQSYPANNDFINRKLQQLKANKISFKEYVFDNLKHKGINLKQYKGRSIGAYAFSLHSGYYGTFMVVISDK